LILFGHHEANNVLEYLAMVITIWLCLLHCKEEALEQECILALGDNTSAVGWLFKTTGVHQDSFCRSFVQTLRWNNIDPTIGTIRGCMNHMAASTIRTSTSLLLGATFKCHYRESPFHLQGNQELCPSIRQLQRAFENVDAPPRRRKAIIYIHIHIKYIYIRYECERAGGLHLNCFGSYFVKRKSTDPLFAALTTVNESVITT
jgi:hypothetical protein